MDNETFEFTLVSPECHILTEQVEMLVVPGEEGDIGVLPHHSALISTLRPGLLSFHRDGTKRSLFITEGFVDINENGCRVLAETAEFVEDLSYEELEDKLELLKEEAAIVQRNSVEEHELRKMRELLNTKIHLLKTLS